MSDLRKALQESDESLSLYLENVSIDAFRADIAELEADQRRLEWLVSKGACVMHSPYRLMVMRGEHCFSTHKDNWREAIDEAMRESDALGK